MNKIEDMNTIENAQIELCRFKWYFITERQICYLCCYRKHP